ncbi:DUF3667 domain-containing protein [Riemerella anatipestifer]|nr:DUF3667 domain-containing protein [Riemerella anatipestifer]
MIHGIWHLDSGIFFTLKELLVRPGHSIREFIQGKRVGYFNFITLLILILGITHFLGEYAQVKLADLVPESGKGTMAEFEEFSKKHPKSLLLLTIPFYSFFSFLWFRKSGLNLTEHFVLNSYKTATESAIALLFLIITIFYTNISILIIVYGVTSFLTLAYGFWFYKQFFSAYGYSKKSLIIRSFGVIFSYMLLSVLVGMVMRIIKH